MDYLQYALMGLGGLFFAVIVLMLLFWSYCIVTTGDIEERIYKLSVVFMCIAVCMCVLTWCLGLHWGRENTLAKLRKDSTFIACPNEVYVNYVAAYKAYDVHCTE